MIIRQPGPLSTVQDLGRTGCQSLGFPVSGAMDTRALRIGNLLLGNPENAAAVEMTMAGMTVEFTSAAIIALTGADMAATLNGEPLPPWTAVYVHKGDTLACGAAVTGLRGYLCVAGGIDVPEVLGSRSTSLKVGLGGFEGRKLKAGDWIGYFGALENTAGRSYTPDTYPDSVVLRAVPGPQDDMFTEKGLDTFFGSVYTVTPESDRMGIRLDGPAIETKKTSDIISDGIGPGSVQIPASGKPIILAADRQTTGGYAKIAAVCSADLWRLAQARPGTKITFERITLAAAQKLYARAEKEYRRLACGKGWITR